MKKVEVQLKVWALEAAERDGVTPGAIYVRLARGSYPGLKLRRVSRAMIFVGEGYRPKARKLPRERYDYSGVDWTQRSSVIARQLGCDRTTVCAKRRRMAQANANRRVL